MKRLIALCLLITGSALAAGGNDPDDPAKRIPVRISNKQKAPEFDDIETWINSEPLTMAKLKGKVVVIHFMAFG